MIGSVSSKFVCHLFLNQYVLGFFGAILDSLKNCELSFHVAGVVTAPRFLDSPAIHIDKGPLFDPDKVYWGLCLSTGETAWREEAPRIGSLKDAEQGFLLGWEGAVLSSSGWSPLARSASVSIPPTARSCSFGTHHTQNGSVALYRLHTQMVYQAYQTLLGVHLKGRQRGLLHLQFRGFGLLPGWQSGGTACDPS